MNRQQRRVQASRDRKAIKKVVLNPKSQVIMDIVNRVGLEGIEHLFPNPNTDITQFSIKQLKDLLFVLTANHVTQENVKLFVLKIKEPVIPWVVK